jgi:hypothetical protein
VQLVEVALYAGIISFAAVLGYESDKLKKVFGEIAIELIEVALYAGIIFVGAVLNFGRDESKKVFWEMQVKLKKRLKDWET